MGNWEDLLEWEQEQEGMGSRIGKGGEHEQEQKGRE